MRSLVLSITFLFFTPLVVGQTKGKKTILNVGIYSWLPEAGYAIEKLERAFEQQYPEIDANFRLVDPYSDGDSSDEFSSLADLKQFDVFEIDAVRLDELVGGKYGGIEKIPAGVAGQPNTYIAGASTLKSESKGQYIIPHWVCGNFLVQWSKNSHDMSSFEKIKELLNAIDLPLFADLYGTGTLGEYYADAVLDIYGHEVAKKHLIGLYTGDTTSLLPVAENRVLALINEMPVTFRDHLSKYHDLPSIYPRSFADHPNSCLIGYSERMYYVEQELQFSPSTGYVPIIKADELVVQQFPFSSTSQGTPTWVDGFVIPQGKLAKKEDAITKFLNFIQTKAGYLPFVKPRKWGPASNLLPAVQSMYNELEEEAPLLKTFLHVFDASFPIYDEKLYEGVKLAGKQLKAKTKQIFSE
ncbi:MAG: hypothetical protein ACPGJS_21810 [Flammeovirgaceae bacterium]